MVIRTKLQIIREVEESELLTHFAGLPNSEKKGLNFEQFANQISVESATESLMDVLDLPADLDEEVIKSIIYEWFENQNFSVEFVKDEFRNIPF